MDEIGDFNRPYALPENGTPVYQQNTETVENVESGENGQNDDEYEEENAIELIKDFSSHKMMTRIHVALMKQLKERQFLFKGELVEKKEELKRLVDDRETHGKLRCYWI